ncbi:MAG: prolyl oligopeptidase family serine peptidase [Rhodobacteraceae bacterium]|jgi:polyhydroxybutyrate depolymerase|nr:prolyl oligopeptidase family serine peptidase [Paracoccaceae bacterium]
MNPAVPLRAAALCAGMAAAGAAQAGCGPDTAACTLPGGSYHVVLPEGAAPDAPAVVFLHGYGSSGAGTLRNTGMVDALVQRGYAVIAPDGQPRAGREGLSWDFHPARPARRDEGAFVAAVADDAAARFGLDRDAMLLAGFSIGGSLTSYIACATPDAFAAYAPVAGSFWRPHPDGCAGPVDLFHIHGWRDGTVPLEGRVLGSGFEQGDVFAAMAIWRDANGCRLQPDAHAQTGDIPFRSWTTCESGARLDFALHPGGHSVPPGWATLALDWFEALP